MNARTLPEVRNRAMIVHSAKVVPMKIPFRFVSLVLCVLMVSSLSRLRAETPNYDLDTSIVVTARRTPMTFSELTRAVVVLNRVQIEQLPVRSVEELLTGALGVDVRRRGANGVQADIGIRGGSFEQTLVLVDGVKVNDPQTGHHNLDIPISLDEIERIEVLKGSGTKLYGPNAMGGVINIITRPAGDRRVKVSAVAGEHRLFEQEVSTGGSVGPTAHTFSYARKSSEGFRENTEFDITTLGYSGRLGTGRRRMSVSARYAEKDFGAYRFYSDAFPDEREATRTLLLVADGSLELGAVEIVPGVFLRRHDDDFILDRNRPSFFRNNHRTDQVGGQLQISIPTRHGTTVLGGEMANEEISGNSLGGHSRNRGGLFFEYSVDLASRWTIVPGAAAYRYTDYGWKVWPGLDIGFRPADQIRTYATVGKSFRVPTFTDLYYVSPANIGNPGLVPESAWSYEAGASANDGNWVADFAVFVREGKDQIDWVRESAADPWQVRNVANSTTTGIEIGVSYSRIGTHPGATLLSGSVRYTYLNSDRSYGGLGSKYDLDLLRHQLIAQLAVGLPASIVQTIKARYLQRFDRSDFVVVDSRVTVPIGAGEVFLEATNLLNTSFVELGSIPMPDRWIRSGLSIDLYGR